MCEAQDVQQTNHEVGLTGTVGVWCRAVLGVVRRWPACLWLGAAGLASCWVPVLLPGGFWWCWLAGCCAVKLHHARPRQRGGVVGLLAPPTWPSPPLPTPDRQGHSPRYDRTRNLNGFTQRRDEREKKKEGAGGNSV